MEILTPVIGIPNYLWKRQAVKFARKNPFIIKIKVKDLCYECDRHREILKMFDTGNCDYRNSNYFIYAINRSKKPESVVLDKISRYKNMYFEIKGGNYSCPKEKLPIIIEDGCRLDGSHRLTILEHIGEIETDVNVLFYRNLFSEKKSKQIFKENIDYRKKVYNL
jgi:hypothetical protein